MAKKKNLLIQPVAEAIELEPTNEPATTKVIELEPTNEPTTTEPIKPATTSEPAPTTYTLNSGRGTVMLWARHFVTFEDGTYTTADIDEIQALDGLADAGTVTRHKRAEGE